MDKKITVSVAHPEEENGAGQTGQTEPAIQVTSHLYLKPTHSAGTLDKEVVLRRIRHRKRVNSVKKMFQSFLGYPACSPGAGKEAPVGQTVKWAGDPFAGP